MRITKLTVRDIRFPTSQDLAGSDAMNPDPDYSAAYVVLETDSEHCGHGLAFTLGRGTEIVVQAVKAFAPLIAGRSLEEFTADMGKCWRRVTGDSQLRWIGPEKGAVHLAAGAVVNAVWDLWAKSEGKPVWRLVADFSPEEFVRAIDFRYITDALSPGEARELLAERADLETQPHRPHGSLGLPSIYDLRRLAGLFRRKDPRALPRRARKGVGPLQDQSRPRSAGGYPPLPDHPRRNRPPTAL